MRKFRGHLWTMRRLIAGFVHWEISGVAKMFPSAGDNLLTRFILRWLLGSRPRKESKTFSAVYLCWFIEEPSTFVRDVDLALFFLPPPQFYISIHSVTLFSVEEKTFFKICLSCFFYYCQENATQFGRWIFFSDGQVATQGLHLFSNSLCETLVCKKKKRRRRLCTPLRASLVALR